MTRQKASSGQRIFHVDKNDATDRWDVCDDEVHHIMSCPDKHQAVAYAVRQAMHDHAEGKDVLVCVQRPDGTHEIAWSS